MKPEAKGVRIRKLTVMANFQDKKRSKVVQTLLLQFSCGGRLCSQSECLPQAVDIVEFFPCE